MFSGVLRLPDSTLNLSLSVILQSKAEQNMELRILGLVFSLLGISQSSDWSLTTEQKVTALMIHHTTLTCNYTGPLNDWVFMRWQKAINDTTTVQLGLLKNTYPDTLYPEWSSLAPKGYRNRVALLSDYGDNSVTFSMRNDRMQCEDQGRYICQIYTASGDSSSASELVMEAYPEQPLIHNDYMEVSENDTFSVDCYGKVGIPQANLKWQYKMAGSDVYTFLDQPMEQTQKNTPSSDCIDVGVGKVTMKMKKSLDGAVLRCYADSSIIDPQNSMYYDEITLVLHRETTKAPVTTTTQCAGNQCNTVDDGGSGAADVRVYPLLLILALTCVMTLQKYNRQPV